MRPRGEKRVGPLITEYAAVSSLRPRAKATWSATHGLATNPGPLVSPITMNCAEVSGIGRPAERFSGMPIPGGHCGQLTS